MFSLLVFVLQLASTLATPFSFQPAADDIQEQATFFNSYWTDNTPKVTYKNGPAGQYSVTWNSTGNFVGGKGWNPGAVSRIVNYTGTYEPNGYSYLAVYGWTTSPLVEYYVIESYHPDHEPAAPPEGQEKGNLTSDGSLYIIRTKMRVGKPSIEGTATFRQIFSVRQQKRSTGVVTVGNHFEAWNAAGLKTGTHNYMILAVEGMNSSGMADMTVY